MPGIGLQGAYGLAGAQDALTKMVAQRKMDELLKQKDIQQQFENQMKQREQASVEGYRTAQMQPTPEPPEKPVVIGGRLVMPSTGEVRYESPVDPDAKASAYLATERASYDKGQNAERQHKFRLGEISAQGAETRRTQAAKGGGAAEPDAAVSPYAKERSVRVVQSVDELMKKVSRATAGVGTLTSWIPETPARNFATELDTLKANVAFNELTAMREASKTGGALGQVSDREGILLQSALGGLDAGQSPENLKIQLHAVKRF